MVRAPRGGDLAVALAPAGVRRAGEATRGRRRAPDRAPRLATKAARCRCNVACQVRFRFEKGEISDQIRLDQLSRIEAESVDLEGLKAAGLIGHRIKRVKIIASGAINRAIVVKGLVPTKSARVAIEAAGGRIED